MTITASQVKELRERTGAGMMECKKALEVSSGDLEKAIDELRKWGKTKADKKAGRATSEGAIALVTSSDEQQAVMVEINSETDFVARDANFLNFLKAVANTLLASKVDRIEALTALPIEGGKQTIEEARHELVSKVGENVQIQRIAVSNPGAVSLGAYVHGSRIGVIVELDIDNKELARDIAMHIAASKPLVIAPEDVPQTIIDREKEIYLAQASNSGKPQDIVEKMVAGRLQKFLAEVSLLGQPFVKEPEITVGGLLNKYRAKVTAFTRFEVGEESAKGSENEATMRSGEDV